jgi:hypothetical protein
MEKAMALNKMISKQTNELLTSRIGLLATAHTINTLSLSNTIDQHFPAVLILGLNMLQVKMLSKMISKHSSFTKRRVI